MGEWDEEPDFYTEDSFERMVLEQIGALRRRLEAHLDEHKKEAEEAKEVGK